MTTTRTPDRYTVMRWRIDELTLEQRGELLYWLSGYSPDAVEKALDWRHPLPPVCQVCNDQYVIPVAGPDENGQYDTDDCPCQTVPDFDPENERREP